VSGCRTHGDLVGGYVLRALAPDEMDEMRRHVPSCPHCRVEARELGGLPALLDRIEPDDVPPPVLSPAVEEAVLDRFARERGHQRRVRRPLLTPRRIGALAAACVAALAVALVLVWPSGDDGSNDAYASASLVPRDGAAGPRARAWAWDVPAGTRVQLRARGLSGGGAVYELWCVRPDGSRVSGGTFRPDRRGRAQAELTAAVRPGDYHLMVVTRRMGSRAGPGREVLRGELVY
jgi:anti-sigma-K factor RskA